MKIFSFFAGVGMLDLGFQDAGYEIVFVNEFKQEFMNSYCYARRKRNYNQPIYGYHVNVHLSTNFGHEISKNSQLHCKAV